MSKRTAAVAAVDPLRVSDSKLWLRNTRYGGIDNPAAAARAIEELVAGFDSILSQRTAELTFADLYRKCYNLVCAGFGALLYEHVQHHLTKGAAHYSGRASGHKKFQVYMILVRDICMFLNVSHVVRMQIKTIEELADEAWRARPNVWRRVAARVRVVGRLTILKRMWEDARFTPGMSGFDEALANWQWHGGAQ